MGKLFFSKTSKHHWTSSVNSSYVSFLEELKTVQSDLWAKLVVQHDITFSSSEIKTMTNALEAIFRKTVKKIEGDGLKRDWGGDTFTAFGIEVKLSRVYPEDQAIVFLLELSQLFEHAEKLNEDVRVTTT